MTTVITRILKDEAEAQRAVSKFMRKAFPEDAVEVIAGGDAESIPARLREAEVHESAVERYAEAIAKGNAAVIARVTHFPLNAPRMAREILEERDPLEMEGVTEDRYYTDPPEKAASVLKSHPRFLTARIRGGGPVMGAITVIRRKKANSAVGKEGHVSRRFWPMPLLSTKQRKIKVYRGGRFFSKYFWPLPLLSSKPRRLSVIEGGGPVFSRKLGWPTV